jgi:nucleoside-specific outer membrane channel protein Tsx
MSIVQTQTTSFKAQLYQGIHDLTTDVIKIALYTAEANLNEATTAYSTTNEVVASGYSAGGLVLTPITVNSSGYTAYVGFPNVTWTAALTARCALIYNSSKANRSVAVLDFGADKTSTNTFTITMPPNTATDALLRSSAAI